ncbi:Lin1244/Lin1753 domain-containing protein [Butyricimonas faecihominis]|jgi:hypothetical protein|nr:MAG TPA: protein of unknown function DUF4373 [Caudoviricetes sp.]
MSKDAYYFTHDSNAKDDPKCALLIDQLGMEGYGIYWMLIEVLRDQPDYKYPLALLPSLARKYNTTPQKIEAVVRGYQLFAVEGGVVFMSETLVKRMCAWENEKIRRSLLAKKAVEARWNRAKELPQKCDSNTDVLPMKYEVIPIKENKRNINKKIIKEKSPRSPKGEVDLVSLKDQFEIFRKRYPGTKRGLDTEFNEFVKKYNGHVTEIVPLLLPALENLMRWREQAAKRGEFVPSFANLKTWINQRRWETEYPVESLNTIDDEHKTSVKFD